MNKRELIEAISAETDFNLTACEKMLNATLDTIMNEVAKNDVVMLKGFGTFSCVATSKKTINSIAGGRVTIPAKRRPKFSAGKYFKDVLN